MRRGILCLFVEALQRLDYIEYLLDGLLSDDLRERTAIVTEYGKEVRAIEQRISGLAAAGPGGREERAGQRRADAER